MSEILQLTVEWLPEKNFKNNVLFFRKNLKRMKSLNHTIKIMVTYKLSQPD